MSWSLAGLRMQLMLRVRMLTSGWKPALQAVHAVSCLSVAVSLLVPVPLACLSAASSAGRDLYSNLHPKTTAQITSQNI